jgi:hypothetical protein
LSRDFAPIMETNESHHAAHTDHLSRKERERQEAIDQLRKYMTPGSTVLTILRKVSTSGMTRWIDVHVIVNNQPLRFTWTVAIALELPYDKKQEALKIKGCGLNVDFDVTYRIAQLLHAKGDALNHQWL